ncbi:hypothetical protein B0H19DRAFT_1070182 [Mycena capillaripes]|nr:hypothetical protein B0H19DRAFT_1070182 [Mycena capillaripes]
MATQHSSDLDFKSGGLFAAYRLRQSINSVQATDSYPLQMRDHKSNFKQTWQSQNTQEKIAFLMNSSLDLESGGLCVVYWVKKRVRSVEKISGYTQWATDHKSNTDRPWWR